MCAKIDVSAILASLTVEASAPVGEVKKQSDGGTPWPCVRFDCALKRNGREVWSGPYSYGVGHFTPTVEEAGALSAEHNKPSSDNKATMLSTWAYRPYANFTDKALQASAAAAIARMRNFAPTAAVILPALISEGAAYFDALTFSDWCDEFGYSDDSIRHREIFDACNETGRKLARAFSHDEIDALREWAAEQ